MKVKTGIFMGLALVMFCFVMPASAVENVEIGELQLIGFSDIHAYAASRSSSADLPITVSYNETSNAIEYNKSVGQTGEIYFGGLYPATNTTYTLDVQLERDDYRNQFYFYTSTSYIMIQRWDTYYKVWSFWENDTGAMVSSSITINPLPANDRVIISIVSNETNRSNAVSCNGDTIVTPYKLPSLRDLSYPVVSAPIAYGEAYVPSGYLKVHIYNFTQTIPRKTVTTFGNDKVLGFGLDYPRQHTTTNGTSHMQTNGQVGTVWADVLYSDATTRAYTKNLLDNGWELGIHFSQELTTLSLSDAYSLIDSEMDTMYGYYGIYPSSWCSLKNADNITHANYVYSNYGAYWRNGNTGISFIPNVGNVHNGTWNWWETTANNATVFPTFAHQIDITQAIAYSLDADKFVSFSDIYASKNIDIVGFYEYYMNGISQAYPVVITESSDDAFGYTLINDCPNVNVMTNLDGWVIKTRNGITESIFETSGNETFSTQPAGAYLVYEIPFSVSYDSGIVDTAVSTWSATKKVWTLSSETQQSVTHTIGDLPANTDIQIKRDDINYETVTSNETGYIEWVYDGGFSEHIFSIECHDFNASLTSGAYPLTTQFTTSSDGIDAYYWDFENDGIIDSTKQNPAHTYGQTGEYSVNLTVHTSEGNVSTVKPGYITVSAPAFASDPVAWFNWVFSYLFGRF